MTRRFQDRMRAEREAEILAVAEDRLLVRGCVSFSVDEVVAGVGVAKGTVYNHFPGRDDLIRKVLQGSAVHAESLLTQALTEVEGRDLPAPDFVIAMLRICASDRTSMMSLMKEV